MDSKVLKLMHKGKKSTLQTSKKTQEEEEDGLTLAEEEKETLRWFL